MTNSKIQHEAWTQGGAADEYFQRNREALNGEMPPSRSLKLFASYVQPGQRILEIGSANGHQLNGLCHLTGCEGFGIDPSPEAIRDGAAQYPSLGLSVGSAEKLDFPNEYFDAVIFGFCLYLVDRSLLPQVVAEADRVLRGGGKLMITDFDPPIPLCRPFIHRPGLWSYKMQYPALWLANPAYVLAEKVAFSHHGETWHPDPNERVASWVLVKAETTAYSESEK